MTAQDAAPELAALRAERDRARQWKARAVAAEVERNKWHTAARILEAERDKARDLWQKYAVRAQEHLTRAEAAEAKLAEVTAAIERVRALAADGLTAEIPRGGWSEHVVVVEVSRLRDALAPVPASPAVLRDSGDRPAEPADDEFCTCPPGHHLTQCPFNEFVWRDASGQQIPPPPEVVEALSRARADWGFAGRLSEVRGRHQGSDACEHGCDGNGVIYVGHGSCRGCSDYPGIQHDPACGVEPCPVHEYVAAVQPLRVSQPRGSGSVRTPDYPNVTTTNAEVSVPSTQRGEGGNSEETLAARVRHLELTLHAIITSTAAAMVYMDPKYQRAEPDKRTE